MTVEPLARTGPLHHWNGRFAALPDGVQVLPEAFVAQASLRLAAAVDLELPTTPNTWIQGEFAEIIWMGPDEWLLLSPFMSPQALESRLREHGAVVDVSSQRTTLRLRGEHIRDVLSSGCAIDLHPSVFGKGSCAQTTLGRAGIVLLALDDTGTDYRLLVRSSFARYLAEWLIDAAQEYRA